MKEPYASKIANLEKRVELLESYFKAAPPIEEPKPRKELWEVLRKASHEYTGEQTHPKYWGFIGQIAREYLEKERNGE